MFAWLAPLVTAQTTVYWDLDGKTAGAGGGTTPSGTWSTSNSAKNWSASSLGTSKTTSAWTDGDIAVFSAGTTATGSYTITLGTAVTAAGITIEEGTPTISGTNTLTLSSGATINTASTLTIDAPVTVSSDLTITGGGTVAFSSTLAFSGNLNLDGSALNLNGQSLSLGTLTITGNSVIDFGGATTLSIGTLTIASGATLTITGWNDAVDYFYAASFTGATADSRGTGSAAQVSFSGYSGGTLWRSVGGEITPVPEPSIYGAVLMMIGGAIYCWRRRTVR
ncbi:MAG TPA: PEP-CTERM sorting domain-containing protein [Rariglobus sp.]|jgi:hypothetical protein|nr:PEP-CTERM sorting domain-containing protein [Rariglobus sp.]